MSSTSSLSSANVQFTVLHMKSLYDLYESNEATDAHFVIAKDGTLVKLSAHKVILAAASPVFKAMFYGPLNEEGDITLADESAENFKVFLQAIYHQTEAINMMNIGDIMSLADKYDVGAIMDYCTQFLATHINTTTVCTIIGLALRYQRHALLWPCDSIVANYWYSILSSDLFLGIDCATLEHIVRNEGVLRHPKEIFDACIRWAQKSCEMQSIEATPDNLRAGLGPCIEQIINQFDRITESEFVALEREHPIFTFDEYKTIIQNFNNKPKGKRRARRASLNIGGVSILPRKSSRKPTNKPLYNRIKHHLLK